MTPRPVEVTSHARDQAWQRFRLDLLIENVVRKDVAEAITAGRISNHKIDGFLLFGEHRRELPDGQRFVWTKDERRGYIVARELDRDVVVTALSRAGVHRVATT